VSNPFLSARIPPDLLKKVEEHIAQTGESKSEILIKALTAYLNYSPPILVAPTKIDEICSRLTAIEEQAASSSTEKVTVLEERIEVLNQQIDALQQKVEEGLKPPKDPLNDIYERHYGNGYRRSVKSKPAR